MWDRIGGPPTGGSAHDSGHTQRIVLDGQVRCCLVCHRGWFWDRSCTLFLWVIRSSVHRQLCPVWEHVFNSGLFGPAGELAGFGRWGADWQMGFHKLRKTFSKFYRRYYDLISKFQVGLKSLLRQGLSEPDFYGDLVYKLKKIVGSNNFSAQFIKIISHYKKIGYNINVLQQTACLVVNPITVGNFAFLFNCTPVGRTSDSMMVPT